MYFNIKYAGIMIKEDTFLFGLIKHAGFSWSYVYMIDNLKHGFRGSLTCFKKKSIGQGFSGG